MVSILHNFRKHAECECCDAKDVDVYLVHGNMWQCAVCKQSDEQLAIRTQEAQSFVVSSKAVDSAVQIKTDIFSAKTVAAIELHGAITADDAIPEAQKEYAFTKVCFERYMHFKQVVFEQRQALVDMENEMRMWQVNAQTAAGRLRADLRAEFKALDVTYEPKAAKPAAAGKTRAQSVSSSQSPKALKQARMEAAKTYGFNEAIIEMMCKQHKISADEAGKRLAQQRAERESASQTV